MEQDSDQRDQRLDLNKEILRLKFEKDQQREKMEKILKKLEAKRALEADYKLLKEEKLKQEEDIRKLYSEKSEEKEATF